MQNAQHVGGGIFETVADPTWSVASIGDYNGDGTSDILWRNSSSGLDTVWTIHNAQHTGGIGVDAVADLTWGIVKL